jgi:hypothetical protein
VQRNLIDPEQAYVQAQKEFIDRGVTGNPVTKYELYYWDELKKSEAQDNSNELHP